MLLQLYFSFVQIGLFSIGGGLAALPLIQEQVVDTHGWLSLKDFTDLVTIAQMTPGPIAINASTFVGTKVGGLLGAIIATLGCVTPSIIIVMILAWIYFRYQDLHIIKGILSGLRPAIVALIASAGFSLLSLAFLTDNNLGFIFNNINFIAIALSVIALFILRRYKVNPIFIMIGCGFVGGLIYLFI